MKPQLILSLLLISLFTKTKEIDINDYDNIKVMMSLGVSKEDAIYLDEHGLPSFEEKKEWSSEDPLNKTLLTEDNSDWMAKVPDYISISKLAIPGTHDTCTFRFISLWRLFDPIVNFFGRTQVWNITEQLEAGIRYLDLRPAGDGNIFHGILETTTSFRGAFEEMRVFLNKHPSEGLIVRAKFENNTICDGDCVEKKIRAVLNDYKDILYISKKIPTMKELRGKVFVLVNYNYEEAFDWDKDFFYLQDYYDLNGKQEEEFTKKKNLIDEYMDMSLIKDDTMLINHCSAAGNHLLVSLKYIADNMNEVPYEKEIFAGILPLDYPSEELLNRIIRQNKIMVKRDMEEMYKNLKE